MFEPEHKSKWYLLVVFGVASIIGWSIYKQYKPLIINTSCSEIAAKSSSLIKTRNEILDSDYSYEKIKDKCIQESAAK